MGNEELNLKIVVDASQLSAGMSAAGGAVESASVKMAQSLKAASLSAVDAASAMKNLGFSAEETSTALRHVGLVSAEAATQIETAAVSLTGMDRAMALASGRIAGMAAGSGMLGGALGRVAAASSTLGPLLSAAFPVLAVAALVDMGDILWEKLRKLSMEALENSEAWQKINHEGTAAMESVRTQIDALDARLAGLAHGRLAELQTAFKNIGDGSVEMSGKMLTFFDGMGNQLEKEVTWFEKIREAVTFINTNGLVLPNQGEIAKAFGSELSKTLDTKGLAAGVELVTSEVARLNGVIDKNPGDKGLKEYQDQLIKVLGLLQQKVTLQNKEKDVNIAEQAKEQATEQEKITKGIEKAARDMEREALAQQSLADSAAKLAGEKADFGAKNDGTAERIRASEAAMEADREFQQDRLTDAKNASIAAIGLQEDEVREKLRLGQLTNSQEAQQLKELEAQKLTIERQYLDQRIGEILARLNSETGAAYAEDVKAWSKLLSEKLKAEIEYQNAIQKATDSANKAIHESTANAIKAIGGDFTQGFISWMNGQKTFVGALQQVWTRFADTIVSALLKAGFQMVAQEALQNSLAKSTQLSKAEEAASNTWASVSAIPIIGPFLAPEAAAAAFAGVMAFEQGGMVPGYGPTPAIVHGGEMILNQDQQRALGGGGHTFQYNNYGSGSAEQTRTSAKEFFKMAKREMRRMNR